MLLPISLMLPLLALWLWWPVSLSSKRQRRWHIGSTLALALPAPIIAVLWRSQLVGYVWVAWLQLLFGGVVLVFALVLLFVVLRDAAWLLGRGRDRSPGWTRWAQFWHNASVSRAALAAIVLLSLFGIYNGLKVPELHRRELVLEGLPAEFDGLQVAVLTDLHISPVKGAWRTKQIVARIMATQPDLIVLPGDMVDGELAITGPQVAALAKLRARYGVWVAPGNHEYYHGYRQWMTHFRELGLGVLENEATLLSIKGRTLAVSGVGDLAFRSNGPRERGGIPPDIPAVVAQANGSDFHVLLAHQPKQAAQAAASAAIDLQISGHTHGGHILGMDRWIVAPFNDGFVRGEYQLKGMKLFVSSGAGQWDGFTARLGVPSSIDVLVLRRAASDNSRVSTR